MHAAEELFCESGPPANWWQSDPPPRGPNDETIVYRPEEVRLCAPVRNPARVGTDTQIACHEEPECEMKLAAVIGKPGMDIQSLEARPYIAGYTAMTSFGARLSALGPYLVTPDEFDSPYTLQAWMRINGEDSGQTHTGNLRSKFEQAIETLSRRDVILPGDVIAFRLDLQPKVRRGDLVELEIERIGTLRTPLA
jgi:2-keto-4-pentenoate hydratase/2-oxohepta-3-ene-1,7-dioic acid hydratase in catechol pathway